MGQKGEANGKSSSRDCGYSFDANGQAIFLWYSKELVSLVQLGSRVHVPLEKGIVCCKALLLVLVGGFNLS